MTERTFQKESPILYDILQKRKRQHSKSRSGSKSQDSKNKHHKTKYHRNPIKILQEFIKSLNHLLAHSHKVPNIIDELSIMQQILLSSLLLIQQNQQLLMQTQSLNQQQQQLQASLQAFAGSNMTKIPNTFLNAASTLSKTYQVQQHDTQKSKNIPNSVSIETARPFNHNKVKFNYDNTIKKQNQSVTSSNIQQLPQNSKYSIYNKQPINNKTTQKVSSLEQMLTEKMSAIGNDYQFANKNKSKPKNRIHRSSSSSSSTQLWEQFPTKKQSKSSHQNLIQQANISENQSTIINQTQKQLDTIPQQIIFGQDSNQYQDKQFDDYVLDQPIRHIQAREVQEDPRIYQPVQMESRPQINQYISIYDRSCLLVGVPLDFSNQDIIEQLISDQITPPISIDNFMENGLEYLRLTFQSQHTTEKLLLAQPSIRDTPILYLPYMEDCDPLQMLLNHQLQVKVIPKCIDQVDLYSILIKYGRIIDIINVKQQTEQDGYGLFIVTFAHQGLPARLENQNLKHPYSQNTEVIMNFQCLQVPMPIARKIYSATIHAQYQQKQSEITLNQMTQEVISQAQLQARSQPFMNITNNTNNTTQELV